MKLIFLIFLLILPISLLAVVPKDLKHDGKLSFFHAHFYQYFEITYEENGKLIPENLNKINHFLRSRDSGEVKKIDINLIYLVDHLQDHFQADTIMLISGYRSPKFNRYLKSIGRNVSDKSNHMLGKAMDIHFEEITEKVLWEYVKSLKLGGAGYYPDINMVHVDVGSEVKTWVEGRFTNRTDIGFFYQDPKIIFRTDQLFYFDGMKMELALKNKIDDKLYSRIDLQCFKKGKWRDVDSITLKKRDLKKWIKRKNNLEFILLYYNEQEDESVRTEKIYSKSYRLRLNYGRYRLVIYTTDDKKQFSNEFYLKRI